MINQTQADMPRTDQRPPEPPRVFDADELLGSARAVQIKLDQQVYTLRRTRFGKLLLTK